MNTLFKIAVPLVLLSLPETHAFVNSDVLQFWNTEDPAALFQSILWCLVLFSLALKCLDLYLSFESSNDDGTQTSITKPASIVRLERKFLSVFWLIRTAFWMSGPYFYSACASKTFNGEQISVSTISKIALTGYISTPIFGPFAVNFLTEKGPKVGSIIAAVLYALGALSLCSNSLPILFVGRGLGGIGTSMISSAPEAWLVSEVKAKDKDSAGMWLPGIFGTAFQFDPIVAIFAGKLAGVFADQHGPTGPFQVSPFILGTAIVLILLFWSSTVSTPEKLSSKRAHPPKDKDTLRSILRDTVLKDTNILLVGCIQVLFESSMNVFLMLWPPTMNAAVISAYGESSVTPYGAIFSCMMASCAVGGLFFGELSRIIGFESMMLTVILCAMSSMVLAAYSVASHEPSSPGSDHLWRLVAAFLLFEACVGAYFPSIGVLRCNHFPDTNLSMIMTLFQLPTNSIVAVMFVFFQSLGNARAFLLTSVLLALGAASMFVLWLRERESHKMLAAQKVRVTGKQVLLAEQFQNAVREAKLEQRGLASRKEGGSLLVRGQSGMIQRSSLGMPI